MVHMRESHAPVATHWSPRVESEPDRGAVRSALWVRRPRPRARSVRVPAATSPRLAASKKKNPH